MDKTSIEIWCTIIQTVVIVITLSFMIWTQWKSKKDNQVLDIAKLLDQAFDNYRNFQYQFYEDGIHAHPGCPDDGKIGKIKQSKEQLLKQFTYHYNDYLTEINILLKRYNISSELNCKSCQRKYKQGEWYKYIYTLIPEEKFNWNIYCRLFYDTKNKGIFTFFCPECLDKEPSRQKAQCMCCLSEKLTEEKIL